jgi:predicted dehydrogenase
MQPHPASRAGHRVIIVGLGEVARTHIAALEKTPGAKVVAGVDTAPPDPPPAFNGAPLPVFTDVAVVAELRPSLVVVATPTRTHAAVCEEVAHHMPDADILVEKPASNDLASARRLLDGGLAGRPVNVAYHMAFSPEVTWAAHHNRSLVEQLGPPTRIVCSFADAYQSDPQAAADRYCSSWLDSGINLLSIIRRFATPVTRHSLRRIGPASWSAYEARISCEAYGHTVEALALTSWYVTDPAKTTRISYPGGAELVMDHTGVAGHLIRHDRIVDIFGSTGEVPRRESHYLAMYKWWLTDNNPLWPIDQSKQLHDLLLQPPDGARIP